MNTYYIVFELQVKKSWRIVVTKFDLDNAKELEEWISERGEMEGEDIFLLSWKKLKAS